MSLLFFISTPALAGGDCAGGHCPSPHDEPVPAVKEGPSDPPPIDQRPSGHLRTATFALG
ncbi:MAG: hypothetical protein H6737_13220 [Alphaproteobacteria bacterium]|nr:hypothetical protein [Alphaproteobacteria bacterium]